jgi:hypothetical protein
MKRDHWNSPVDLPNRLCLDPDIQTTRDNAPDSGSQVYEQCNWRFSVPVAVSFQRLQLEGTPDAKGTFRANIHSISKRAGSGGRFRPIFSPKLAAALVSRHRRQFFCPTNKDPAGGKPAGSLGMAEQLKPGEGRDGLFRQSAHQLLGR